jgi:hypothetical protein
VMIMMHTHVYSTVHLGDCSKYVRIGTLHLTYNVTHQNELDVQPGGKGVTIHPIMVYN